MRVVQCNVTFLYWFRCGMFYTQIRLKDLTYPQILSYIVNEYMTLSACSHLHSFFSSAPSNSLYNVDLRSGILLLKQLMGFKFTSYYIKIDN